MGFKWQRVLHLYHKPQVLSRIQEIILILHFSGVTTATMMGTVYEHFSQLGRLLGTLQEIIQCLGDSYYCSHFKEIEVTNGIGGGARI